MRGPWFKSVAVSPIAEPALLGIPRYKFGAAVHGLKSMVTGGSAKERFTAQLAVLDCFATLYGRHFY